MKVNPITAEKANEQSGDFEPWPAGEYDFSIQDAGEETSTAGNEMIKLTLHVFNRAGNRRTMFDYLVNTEKWQWKVRHFAESVGLIKSYEAGNMDARDVLNRDGRLKLRIKPKRGDYAANNAVNDYLPASGSAPHASAAQRVGGGREEPPPPIDDDIPF